MKTITTTISYQHSGWRAAVSIGTSYDIDHYLGRFRARSRRSAEFVSAVFNYLLFYTPERKYYHRYYVNPRVSTHTVGGEYCSWSRHERTGGGREGCIGRFERIPVYLRMMRIHPHCSWQVNNIINSRINSV